VCLLGAYAMMAFQLVDVAEFKIGRESMTWMLHGAPPIDLDAYKVAP
jgi:hypothetical protein